jgi:hypothetical protein
MYFLSLVLCFRVSLLVYYSRIDFFLVFYSNSTTYKNMKTLNYGQKVHSVYSPLLYTTFDVESLTGSEVQCRTP